MSLLFLYGLLFIEWDIYSFVTADLRLNARNMDNPGSLFQAEGPVALPRGEQWC